MLFKKIIKIISWLCLVLTIALFFLFINLPTIVESQIEKRLPQFLNSADVEFNIQKIGFVNTFISKIRITDAISIDSVNIDYDIKSISSVHINKVTISGLQIHAGIDENNQIKIRGFNLPGTPGDHAGKPDLSFLPGKIVLKNARIFLDVLNKEFLIPFDVLSTINKKDGKIFVTTMVYPFGEKFYTFVTYDINKGIKFVKIEGKSFDSGYIIPFISKKINGVQLTGPVDFSLESSDVSKKWKLNISRIGFIKPIEAVVKDFSTIVLINDQKISANGTFDISNNLLSATRMEYVLNLNLNRGEKNYPDFDLRLKNSKIKAVKIYYDSNFANIREPEFNAWISGSPLKNKGKITLGIKKGRIRNQKESLSFKNMKLSSDFVADFSDQGSGLSSKLSLNAENIRVQSDPMDSTLPSLNVSGIKIEIPIRYPEPFKKKYGKYFVPDISLYNKYSFSTKGRIFQTDSKEFKINGSVIFKTLPDAKTQFDSTIGFKKDFYAFAAFKINPFKLSFKNLGKLIPKELQKADIDATAAASGKAKFLNHKLKTSMNLKINDGRITMPDMNLAAEGINTIVDINDMMVPRSVPGRILSIDSIKVNKIKIKDAKVRFTIEDAKSILIENIRFKWCNGLVSTESIRFPQENNTYSLTLYCDRLELNQLLKQMGAFHSEGTGTLNGRIPVVYSNGNISFDNGFLFSTPGSGGKLVIGKQEKITAGIPMNAPQFAQLDLAREALKDFDFKWAKLVFNSFEDNLDVHMQLDGKPAKVLPFEFRKEVGGFVRVDSSSRGSEFEGMKLDVNLKLPFNEVIKFGNKLKSIFN
ncbi:MAG: hypothetical protein GXP56_09035 [Deltaproteobacteria bacterium]|nr:hypothetical protein [Deltaproteobacteria bacterium]